MRFRRTKGDAGRDRLGMVWAAAWLAAGLVAAGCGSHATDEAGKSDANGYLCSKCQAKFCTERAVFAERCPECQSVEIKTVVGFVCEKDRHTIIAVSGRDSIPCDQCGERTTALRLPSKAELKAWGAEEKSRGEVMIQ